MRSAPTRALALASLLVLNLALVPRARTAPEATSPPRSRWLAPNALGTFVRKPEGAGQTVCIEAGTEASRRIKDRDSNLPLSVLVPESDPSRAGQPGLKILLRGSLQLQSFSPAREAFKRAAAAWEALIRTPVTIVIDVDFGPTLFGERFDDEVVGATDAQVIGGNALYPAVRARLTSKSNDARKTSLYNSLPSQTVPTDAGETAGTATASATLRVLQLLDEIADPDAERSTLGPPPAIGFNSKFNFDFDSSDGIDMDKLDFEAMVVHEIGHVLGFVSCVGQHEMDASVDARPSIWDLFRVRPDSLKDGFSSAPRILTSGGEQSFYAGDSMMPLSTARPDGAGGDGKQASHWKDDNLTGKYIGVMDPTIGTGEHQVITDDDVSVLDAIGYQSVISSLFLVPLISGQPKTGAMIAPSQGLGVVSHTQYSIDVPPGATALRIELNGNQDVDLFARFGERVFIRGFRPESDYFSATGSGFETITITASSSPPLQAGTYYIAVANFGPGDADFTVTATVTGGESSRAPAIFDIRSHLEGDSLSLDYSAVDIDGDFASAEVSLLDETGHVVGFSSFGIDFGNSSQIESALSFTGMSQFPTALRANAVLIDRSGNRSPEATIDFSKADPGGLRLRSASFDGSRLTLKVSGPPDSLELEINGRVVAPPLKIKAKGSGSKLVINGTASQLGLQQGSNRIRVKNSGGWSNILVFRE